MEGEMERRSTSGTHRRGRGRKLLFLLVFGSMKYLKIYTSFT